MNNQPVARLELEQAAADVIAILKSLPKYADARIAVIGGLALWMYLPNGRTTQDVDFIINIQSAPASVKNDLLRLPKSPFSQHAQFFFYTSSNGVQIQIDFCADWQSPYLPEAAKKLKDISSGSVPYISAVDLILFKINSCGLRAVKAKSRTDALDAEQLVLGLCGNGPIVLTRDQKKLIEPLIKDVVKYGGSTDKWWRNMLGLSGAS